jgi:GT2 family glycosyltransferase
VVSRERERALPGQGGERTRLNPPRTGPLFTVVVPTRGDPRKVSSLFHALDHQTLPPAERDIVIVLDGASLPAELSERGRAIGVRVVASDRRRGPGAARNLGARGASGVYLAFTEDDCVPAPDWLASAAVRLEREPDLDALEGATLLPGGGFARRGADETRHFLPTNLFVRRETFERVGGYCEEFFDARAGIYFREDSDFGFTLEEAGARVGFEPAARVEHPIEHSGFLDPLRWARRYEMDALLRARHPRLFRERIEVHAVGPVQIRRPLVRAAWLYVAALAFAVIGAATHGPWTLGAGIVAALCLVPFWAKWRFHPARLPVLPFVPLVLVYSLGAGYARSARERRERGASVT